MEERERLEKLEKQRKMNDLNKANEQMHQNVLVRSKPSPKHKYRTPQVTSSKAANLGDNDYGQIEKMLIRNAHNDLRNDFSLSLERMKQEFSMSNQKLEKQISTLKKATDHEKEEKKRLQEQLLKVRNKQKEESAKEEFKRLMVLGSLAENPNTSKLPRTNKLNFAVKTLVDPSGYTNLYNYDDSDRKPRSHLKLRKTNLYSDSLDEAMILGVMSHVFKFNYLFALG